MGILMIIITTILAIGYLLGGVLFVALQNWGDRMNAKDWFMVLTWPIHLLLLILKK